LDSKAEYEVVGLLVPFLSLLPTMSTDYVETATTTIASLVKQAILYLASKLI